VLVDADAIELQIGVRWRGRISRASIVRVERGGAPEGACDLSILGADVVLTLAEPVTLRGPFGRKRRACVLALSADAPESLVAALAAPPLPE
jgi:hypothetical protein